MSNYTKSTNFTAKDSLPTGDTNKVIRGAEFDTEFNAISVAVATKSDLAGPTFTGTATFADLTGTGTINFTGATVSNLGTVTTADINGGTIDGVTIGGSSAGAGTFSSLTATTADINGGTVDGVTIGGSSAGAGTFSSLVATTADINAGTVDNTVIGGTTPAAGTFSSLTATTANIDGGSIDGAVIGGSTPAAVSGTTGTFSGAVSGTTGTFSGAVTGSNLNVSNWDTAYGWGDHSTQGYLTSVTFSDMDAGAITTSGETFANSDTQIPTNAAVRNWVLTTYPTIVELNDLTANVTWATVPDAYISASSVNQHVTIDKATQSKTYTLNETSTLTLSSSITSGVPVVSVTKEVPQSGVSNNDWDVNSTTENYTRINSAPATTLDFAGFDVSTATFSQTFSISSQDSFPEGLAFNTNGTKMFVVGANNDNVYEYTLSTGFDVSTASYSQSFSVASQDGAPRGVAFNSDGTKMFVIGMNSDAVFEYDLSTGFDVSTASYSQNFSVATEETTPRGIAFNTDGTKMFIVGQTGDDVNEYTLSTGFDVSTASYSQNFSVASQDTSPITISFNADGTKMFMLGDANDTVYEYDLSTGFDVSTASYSQSFSVTAQETNPRGLAFNTDGTKMFVLGNTGDDVTEYDLTPAQVTLGTGSFASADVGKTIEANSGVFVLTATDGSISTTTAPTSYDQVASGSWEMYAVVYNTTDGDLELSNVTVTNNFNVSGGSLNQSFDLTSQSTDPYGIKFNNDGTKMYVLLAPSLAGAVYEYTLSTAYDISTASYVTSFSVTSENTLPEDIAFSDTGNKMFMIGSNSNDTVYQYSLSTNFDLSTASYSGISFNVSSQETNAKGLAFNSDGSKMFVIGWSGDDVNEYDLSINFNVGTATYSQNFSIATEDALPSSLAFSSDGTKMFITGLISDAVHQYTLSTGFDVSTASYDSVSFDVSSEETTPHGLTFNSDGDKLFVVGVASDKVHEYDLSTTSIPTGYHAVHTTTSTDSQYWTDINSMTADEAAGDGAVYYAVSTDDRTTWKVAKGTDGERSIVRNNSGTWQYNSNGTYGSTTWTNGTTNTELATLQEAMEGASVTTGFDFTSASYDSVSFSVASQEAIPDSVVFNNDGTKMFVGGVASDNINEYTLSTAYDVSTATYSQAFSVASQDIFPQGIAFNNDGTKMFVVGNAGDDINEYTLSTGFDVSTASYSQNFSVASQESVPKGIAFNANGTKMFIVGQTADTVNEYALSTGFDLSTASYASVSFSVASQDTDPTDITFSSDGTVMFICGQQGTDEVHRYTLSTGFDLSTASFDQSFSVASEETAVEGITFNNDGTKMYIVGQTGQTVYQYSTSTTSYANQMNKTQLDAVPDANHFTLANDLDLAIIFNLVSGTTVPSSDGVSINFDANSLNQGAVLGTDYNWDFPAADKVRITSLAAQNLKVRII
jgi:hypothetical protein